VITSGVGLYKDASHARTLFGRRRKLFTAAQTGVSRVFPPKVGEEAFAIRYSSITTIGIRFTEIIVQWRRGRVQAGIDAIARPGEVRAADVWRLVRIQSSRVDGLSASLPRRG